MQLACIDVPSIHHTTFISFERELGVMFEVMAESMEAGKEEKMLAEHRNETNTLSMPTPVLESFLEL